MYASQIIDIRTKKKTSLQFQSVLLCSSVVLYCKRIYRHNGIEEHTSKRTLPSLFTVHKLSFVFMSNFSLSVLTAHSLTTQRPSYEYNTYTSHKKVFEHQVRKTFFEKCTWFKLTFAFKANFLPVHSTIWNFLPNKFFNSTYGRQRLSEIVPKVIPIVQRDIDNSLQSQGIRFLLPRHFRASVGRSGSWYETFIPLSLIILISSFAMT